MRSVAGSRRGALLATAVLAVVPALAAAGGAGNHAAATSAHDGLSSAGGATHPRCGGQILRGWSCTFDDEFDRSTRDADRLLTRQWAVQQTGNSGYRTGPTAHPACYVNNPRNVWVSHGQLHLRARQTARRFLCLSGGGLTWLVRNSDSFSTRYTAGMVSTFKRFSQIYGRFSVRAKIPKTHLPGLQETLWLWPVNAHRYGGHDASGEIDFAEFFSKFAELDIPRLHYAAPPGSPPAGSTRNVMSARCKIRWNRFNTYTAVWAPGRIELLLNGQRCLLDSYDAMNVRPPAPFDQPFILVLTQALGVTSNAFNPRSTPLPATTQVDWVRVWKRA